MNELTRSRTTSIYVRGDRTFLRRIKALAAKRGETISDLVRNSIESVHGDELRAMDASFFASDTAHTQHSGISAVEGRAS